MNLDQSMFEFYQIFEDVLSKMGLDDAVVKIHQHISQKRPSVDHMKSMLSDVGFIVRNLDFDQFKYHFADASAMFNHHFIRLAFFDSWRSLVPADQVDAVFDEIESRLNEKKQLLRNNLTLTIPFLLIDATKE